MSLALRKINLSLFRNHTAARLDLSGPGARQAKMIVLSGPNGAGKTNILEAVSLLVPGKGLRGAELAELKSKSAGPEDGWAVSAEIETPQNLLVRIGTGSARGDDKKRIVRIDGKPATQAALAGILAAVWLTPQMDRLFLDGAAARRRFLDRLVYAHTPEHAARLSRYEKTLRERLHLLQLGRADPAWLASLEARIAEDGAAIAAARLALIAALQEQVAAEQIEAAFPRPRLALAGWTAGGHGGTDAADVARRLAAGRGADAAAGRTLEGVHRADLAVFHAEKDIPAALSSTGEQKALLVSIVLAHAGLMRAEKGFVPLILLDEVAAHLDAARRDALFTRLAALEAQVWLTGTEAGVFGALGQEARFFRVSDGRVTEDAV